MNPGDVIAVPFPFVRCKVSTYDEGGPQEFIGWRPGVVFREGDYNEDGDAEGIAHGLGEMLLTVVSTHKPGKYPTRTFYTRAWADPTGARFGKGALRMTTESRFRRLATGYAHPFRVAEPEEGEIQ